MKKIINIQLIILFALFCYSCNDSIYRPPVRIIPAVKCSVEPEAYLGTDTAFMVGAEKMMEIMSNVIFKIEVHSAVDLNLFSLTSSADAIDPQSKVLRTIPADALDESGNFIKPLKDVVIYYNYYIQPTDIPGRSLSLTFSAQDKDYGEKAVTNTITPLRAGSSTGNPLTIVGSTFMCDQNFLNRPINANQHPGVQEAFGCLFSMKMQFVYMYSYDLPKMPSGALNTAYIDFFLCAYLLPGETNRRVAIASHQADIVKTEPLYSPLVNDTAFIRFKQIPAITKDVYDQLTHDNELASWYEDNRINPAVQTPDLQEGDIYVFERYDQINEYAPKTNVRKGVICIERRDAPVSSYSTYQTNRIVFSIKYQN